MSRRKPPRVEEEITANLIPMIDIMFLLLLFFMLGADMGKREQEEVRLPKASVARPDDERRPGETVVNVHHDATCASYEGGARCEDPNHWALGVRGRALSRAAIGPFLRDEADRVGGADRHHVLVRADEGASYGLVQQVFLGCSQVGLYQVDLAIAQKVD